VGKRNHKEYQKIEPIGTDEEQPKRSAWTINHRFGAIPKSVLQYVKVVGIEGEVDDVVRS